MIEHAPVKHTLDLVSFQREQESTPTRGSVKCSNLTTHQVGDEAQAERVAAYPFRDRFEQRLVDIQVANSSAQVLDRETGPQACERQLFDGMTGNPGESGDQDPQAWHCRCGGVKDLPEPVNGSETLALCPLESIEHAQYGFGANRIDDAGESLHELPFVAFPAQQAATGTGTPFRLLLLTADNTALRLLERGYRTTGPGGEIWVLQAQLPEHFSEQTERALWQQFRPVEGQVGEWKPGRLR